MQQVDVKPIDLARLEKTVPDVDLSKLKRRAPDARKTLQGRTVWNINSTAHGGGVAEMLWPLVGYARGLGLDVRWIVIEGDKDFFAITKRLHNHLHGVEGDRGPLGEREHQHYDQIAKRNAEELRKLVRRGDIVICHDPQTAGLVEPLNDHGALVVWRCHIGSDEQNQFVQRGWDFLQRYIATAKRLIFTRQQYVPPRAPREKVAIVAPSIDPLSPKNQPMSLETARAILVHAGIVSDGGEGSPRREDEADPVFTRGDGTPARVQRSADLMHLGRLLGPERPAIVQVSRWDHLKDPIGVMRGFADSRADEIASLVLAGPNVSAIADDPEGAQVLDEVHRAWRQLPHEARRHIYIACLPMADDQENAAIVNALQRHATIVVQKSLHEGFGLTVTEAMWKSKPVIASAVGGIQDQIRDGTDGLLLKDPKDLKSFGQQLERLLADKELSSRLGSSAHARAEDHFLFDRQLVQAFDLFEQVL